MAFPSVSAPFFVLAFPLDRSNSEECSKCGWGTEGSHQKVPDARKARGSQNPTGMTLAEMPNTGVGELVKTISRG